MTFTEFLASISGRNSPFPHISAYSLNYEYSNRMYQEIIVSFFGKDGFVSTDITENEMLTPGERSLYLKIAMFANQYQCYKFLDHIYAAVQAKRPGHYFSLITAIKKINDHCNNTLIRTDKNNLNGKTSNCNEETFKNLNSDILPTNRSVRSALHYQLKLQVDSLRDSCQYLNAEDYRQQQLNLCSDLQKYAPNEEWRLELSDITRGQINAASNYHFLLFKIAIRETQQNDRFKQVLVNHLNTCLGQDCPGPEVDIENFYRSEDLANEKRVIDVMKADQARYDAELAEKSNRSPVVSSSRPGQSFSSS